MILIHKQFQFKTSFLEPLLYFFQNCICNVDGQNKGTADHLLPLGSEHPTRDNGKNGNKSQNEDDIKKTSANAINQSVAILK